MRTGISRWVVSVAVLLASVAPTAYAKPENGPVRVECAVPAGMKTGDEADVVVRFQAVADIQQLNVLLFGDKGVEVVSGTREAVFADVARGATRELPVRVRLTGAKWGSLAVTYQARVGSKTAANGFQFIFGATK